MSEMDLSYKIIVLAMLDFAGFRLTSSQITDFLVEAKITDYFSAVKVLSSLEDAEMIDGLSTNNITYYSINKKGAEALHLFSEKITPAILSDIKKYFEKNGLSMKQSNGLTADYSKISGNNFLVSLRLREDDNIVIDLSFRVPNEAAAKAICTNWRVHYEDVYTTILDKLM